MAKKKTTKPVKAVKKSVKRAVKATKKPAAAKATSGARGRPKGSTQFHTDTLAVRNTDPFSKANAVEPQPGLRRITIEASTPEYALILESLVTLITKSPDKVAAWVKRTK